MIPSTLQAKNIYFMDLLSILNPTHSVNAETCEVCGKQFQKKCTKLRHIRNVHALHSPCEFCLKGLKLNSRPYAYKTHLLRCSVFLSNFSHLELSQKIEKAEYHSMKLRQKPKKIFKEEFKVQEQSPTEDRKFQFPQIRKKPDLQQSVYSYSPVKQKFRIKTPTDHYRVSQMRSMPAYSLSVPILCRDLLVTNRHVYNNK
eukprot:NODE_349_length_10402_cov_0.251286.p6 type:complete len:200 gc:universal NODE_349_length_10402_cov_0.251286:2447-3046(+)